MRVKGGWEGWKDERGDGDERKMEGMGGKLKVGGV